MNGVLKIILAGTRPLEKETKGKVTSVFNRYKIHLLDWYCMGTNVL